MPASSNSQPSCIQSDLFCTSGNSVLALVIQIWLCPTQDLSQMPQSTSQASSCFAYGSCCKARECKRRAMLMPGILCPLGKNSSSGVLCDSDEELSCGGDLYTLLPHICPQPRTHWQLQLMNLNAGHNSVDFHPSTPHLYSQPLSFSECGATKGFVGVHPS